MVEGKSGATNARRTSKLRQMRLTGELLLPIGADFPIRVSRLLRAAIVLALLVFATGGSTIAGSVVATTATEPPVQSVKAPLLPAKSPEIPSAISYLHGQLTIDMVETTLGDVLTRVAAVTGVKIDIPPEANSKHLSVIKSGPGSPREVLASLLRDSHLNYLIQESDADPEKIQSVLIMSGDNKAGTAGETEPPASPSHGFYARKIEPAVKPDEPVTLVTPVPALAETASAQESSANGQPLPLPVDQATAPPVSQLEQANGMRPGALSPPQSLSPQTMSQQLQQMYQQRMQMVQQDRQAAVSSGAAVSH